MRTVGPFEVVREIGRGGMGIVFEVRDPDAPGRRLALKLMRSADAAVDGVRRFEREAMLLARVRHRNVVAVHTFSWVREGPFVVMDLVPGRDLVAHVAAAGRPTPAAAAALVRDLADALVAVHVEGVIHRDLKPANVLIRPDGSPVIIDFGLARAAESSRLTETGALLGTASYMSPEQARGVVVDARTDVYALGAILYWLLVGRAPFEGPTAQTLYAILSKDPAWPREVDPAVPAGLDAICRRAMARAPATRPDAAGLRDELTRWSTEGDAAQRPRRSVVAIPLALGALLALGAARTWLRPPIAPREQEEAPIAAVPSSSPLPERRSPLRSAQARSTT